jgi:hypothetical protein
VPDEPGGARLAVETLLAIRSAPVGFINLAEGDVAGAGWPGTTRPCPRPASVSPTVPVPGRWPSR